MQIIGPINFFLQIFVQDKFGILLFQKKKFCNNLFLPGGLGQGCPGGPGLRGLNEQTI